MVDRNKKLFKNMYFMSLIYFLPKVAGFALIPIYTLYLSPNDYGISDLILSTASLLCPIVVLATPSAVMRFTIENKNDISPFQISVKIFVLGLVLFLIVGYFVTYLCKFNTIYFCFLFFIVASSCLADIFLSYTRAKEKTKLLCYCGLLSCLIGILSNIIFIVVFKLGLYGFLLATIISYLSTIVILYFANNMYLFKYVKENNNLKKEMLSFSFPLIFSGISWWVISSSDRYLITLFCGVAGNGLYSIASKIPIILQSINNVFSQAWIYTLYDSYKTKEGCSYIAKVNNLYIAILTVIVSILIVITIPLASILFSNEFFQAWKIVPPLLLSMLCLCAQSLIGNLFSIYKKTKFTMNISVLIAILNFILNIIFIRISNSPIGAAISSAISFFVGASITYILVIKIASIELKIYKQLMSFMILIFQTLFVELFPALYLYSVFFLVLIVVLNISDFKLIFTRNVINLLRK